MGTVGNRQRRRRIETNIFDASMLRLASKEMYRCLDEKV